MHVNIKIDSRLRQQCSKLKFSNKRRGGSWVEPLPIPVKLAGTWLQRPGVISVMNAALFVGQSAANMRLPPCICGKIRTIEVLHLFRCYTHTCSEQSLRILMWNASYCKNTSIIPDRKRSKIRSEKDREECISKPLLDATFPSEPSHSLPDIKFGLKIAWRTTCRFLA